ncbi:MAG TPA: glycosyltransferase family 2 protein [Phycisphaerae bacterium]|nr:glycosyltransferase family 2 protein [Phycisphaerae bacterium]HRY67073.1 glycosyltransferase family 2 protein [Phycisphaerae bacterium]HSA29821.1 glycosyltransferase family 2 protein [Phycisphaerae bacterium]
MNESLSIIVPAYNEADCIESSLGEILRFARSYGQSVDVVVVDDGSTDKTADLVEASRSRLLPQDPPVTLIRQGTNRGKGAAVHTGFKHARGEIVLFTDADLSAPMSEALHLIRPIEEGACDVAIGSRAVDPSMIGTPQSRLRRGSGRLFNRMVRWITRLDLGDTQCGFKAFRRTAIAPIFALQRVERFAFDVELLYLAAKFGLRVVELPVRWNHVHDSRVSLIRDGSRMLRDLCRIRLNDWRGAYQVNGRD